MSSPVTDAELAAWARNWHWNDTAVDRPVDPSIYFRDMRMLKAFVDQFEPRFIPSVAQASQAAWPPRLPFDILNLVHGGIKNEKTSPEITDGIMNLILACIYRIDLDTLPPVPSTHSLCAKCGCETKGEAALVDGQVWCHPCADACSGPLQHRGGK